MMKRLMGAGFGAAVAMAGAALSTVPLALGQSGLASAPESSHPIRPRTLPERLVDKPSQPPAFSVPVDELGFSAPGPIYLGQRNSFVSLDFLDENRLLFTFRVPGLIHREAGDREAGLSEERQIRAAVLTLPSGTVEAEALWTVHDRTRYLWMLKNGRFLLRDRENLELGDASLELKPSLRFPGPLLWLEMDPAQQFLVTNSSEPTATEQKPGNSDLTVRIMRRESGKVMLLSRSRSAIHLPINSDGYLESLRGNGSAWVLNLNYFSGGSRILGRVESECAPLFDFLSQREVLVTTCSAMGGDRLVAMSTDGRRLWEAQASEMAVWPLVVTSPDGLRLVREALAVNHAVSARAPLSPEEIKGQLVEVLNAADGAVALETTATPVLDAGGNVAISPSGLRVAVLKGGAIQVFELPAPPLLPDPAVHPASK
jgi:hypothetical protein